MLNSHGWNAQRFGVWLLTFLVTASPAAAQPYQIRPGEATVTLGGGFTDNNSFLVVGQPIGGSLVGFGYTIQAGLVPALFPPGAFVATIWKPESGTWSVASNWTGGEVPDNSGAKLFRVFVNNPTPAPGNFVDPVVTLNQGATIAELTVAAGARLEVNDASGANRTLQFQGLAGTNASNAGTIRVTTGAVQLRDLTLKDMQMSQTSGGRLEASRSAGPRATLSLVNCLVTGGTVQAVGDSAEVLIYTVNGQTTLSNGQFSALGGGLMRVQNSATGSPDFEVDGGGLEFKRTDLGAASVSASTLTIDGTSDGPGVTIGGNAGGDFTVTFSGAIVYSSSPLLRGSTPPIIAQDRARVIALGDVVFQNGPATVQFQGGSTISIGGSFVNHCTSPATFDSVAGDVRLTPPPASQPQLFEVAGHDFGFNVAQGFASNFALQRLEIGGGRSVRLEDVYDNTGDGACNDALYVYEFVIGSNADVTVDCCRVYYTTMTGSGTNYNFSFTNGGRVSYVGLAGDVNADGAANAGDIPAFVAGLLNPANTNPDRYFRSDITRDGNVNGQDVQAFIAVILAS